MAYAQVSNSPRLQAVLTALRKHPQGLTGLDLAMEARVLNPAEPCSELRKQGFVIEAREEAKSAAGRRVFRYTLVGEPSAEKIG